MCAYRKIYDKMLSFSWSGNWRCVMNHIAIWSIKSNLWVHTSQAVYDDLSTCTVQVFTAARHIASRSPKTSNASMPLTFVSPCHLPAPDVDNWHADVGQMNSPMYHHMCQSQSADEFCVACTTTAVIKIAPCSIINLHLKFHENARCNQEKTISEKHLTLARKVSKPAKNLTQRVIGFHNSDCFLIQ